MSDPIADMLTRIRNASMVKKERVLIPDSRLKKDILKVMQNKGFIKGFEVSKNTQGYVEVELLYGENEMKKFERVSKPGCRVYTKKHEIPRVLQGMGTVIISTSKGIMTGADAKRQGLGGEIICKIY